MPEPIWNMPAGEGAAFANGIEAGRLGLAAQVNTDKIEQIATEIERYNHIRAAKALRQIADLIRAERTQSY